MYLGSSENDADSSEVDLPKKQFVITLSGEEWQKIKPQQVICSINDKNRSGKKFKTYSALPKHQWSPLIAEHFCLHTSLPCCLEFKNAKVYPNGNNFVTINGQCSECDSDFKGIIPQQPLENARYFC